MHLLILFKNMMFLICFILIILPLTGHANEDAPKRPCGQILSYVEHYRYFENNFYEYSEALIFPPVKPVVRVYSSKILVSDKRKFPVESLNELPDGFFIFVLSNDNKLILSQGKMEKDGVNSPGGHAVITKMAGSTKDSILSAGEFLVVDKKIRWIGNRSGTFRKKLETLQTLLDFFASHGHENIVADSFFYEETEAGPKLRVNVKQ